MNVNSISIYVKDGFQTPIILHFTFNNSFIYICEINKDIF